MNKIQKLLKEHCPNGIEYKKLGEIGSFYGGLNGKTKNDFTDGNAKFITYMNIYNNLALNIHIQDKVKIAPDEKQKTIKLGDILFTGSSENIQECGMSSVLCEEPKEEIYLNSFCFGYRLNDSTILIPGFSKYLFRSSMLRDQIRRTASGVTRFNVSKKKMSEVVIPIPPIVVQEEIVRILDTFSQLQTELQTELDLRKKQYEYYRNKLLSFETDGGGGLNVEYRTLGEIAVRITSGGTPPTSRKEYYDGNIPWLNTKEVKNCRIYVTEKTITDLGLENSSAKWIEKDSVIIAMYGATAGRVAINKIPLTTNQACCNITVDNTKADYNYVYYILLNSYEKLFSMVSGGAQKNLNAGIISDFKIPLPPLEEQKRIVGILDKFDTLVNGITEGIPAEIALRKKQYEYYRDKLLSFEKII